MQVYLYTQMRQSIEWGGLCVTTLPLTSLHSLSKGKFQKGEKYETCTWAFHFRQSDLVKVCAYVHIPGREGVGKETESSLMPYFSCAGEELIKCA